ncbi:MAG: ribonuclease E activity regulator RraA [Reichenbachiella sp.]|uniref:ribonuclease E activity regulator RraA n=1 Tax=Reichenbachiella sp. TaxID=2184521 RepID=UPI00326311B3
MLKVATADLWDQHSAELHCADPIFRSYGNKVSFHGEITTVKLFEDNSFVRQQLTTNGKGKVMVVDGGGSFRCALVGDQLASLAIENGWEGLIINGCIRDSAMINTIEIGIRALNTCPVKSMKKNIGELDVPIRFASTLFAPGHYVYVDEDGILVSEAMITH